MSSPAQPTKPVRDTDLPAKDLSPGATTSGSTTATAVDQPPVDLDAEYGRSAESRQNAGQTGRDTREQTERTLHEVQDFTREAGDKAQEQWRQARQGLNQARQQLGQQWQEQRGNVANKARSTVTQQKDRAADGVADIASAARAAANELRDRNDETIAGYAETAANQLEHLKDYLRHAEVDDLVRDVAGFARRQPEWFLGGAFVAGLAVARFLKADDRVARSRGVPEDADPALFDDLVDQQHGTASRAAMPGVPSFGDEAPFAVGTMPADEPSATAATPGTLGTPPVQPEVPDVTPPISPAPAPGATPGNTTTSPSASSGTTGDDSNDPLSEPRGDSPRPGTI